MAADKEVLREFLMQLGFTVDETAARRFIGSVLGVSKAVTNTATAIAGVAVAAEAMVQSFASGMEKLFYMAQRTRASVESLQAARFAAAQVGVTVDEMTSSVEGFSRALRMNPGMGALLKGLGVDMKGKDAVQQMYALVGRLSKMPHFIGAQWAQMFGMDERTFLMLKERLPELLEADRKRRDMNKEAGIDAAAAAAASREYSNALREVWERITLLYDALSIKLLPYFRQFIDVVNIMLTDAAKFEWSNMFDIDKWGAYGAQVRRVGEDIRFFTEAVKYLFTDNTWVNAGEWAFMTSIKGQAAAVLNLVEGITALLTGDFARAKDKLGDAIMGGLRNSLPGVMMGYGDEDTPGAAPGTPGSVGAQRTAANDPFATRKGMVDFANAMAKTYGIPPALFRALVQHESGWNPLALGTSGEIGLTQLMPGTATEVGVKNLEDPEENLRGGAAYLAKQYRKHGNWRDALSAYNAGGNLGAGRGYADTVLGMAGMGGGGTTIAQNNTFNISGSGDPDATARAVGREISRTNQDLARNRTGSVR